MMRSAKYSTGREVVFDGFRTVQQPLASTGASFHAAMRNGKFHGTIWPTTPIGSRRMMLMVVLSSIVAEPSSARMQPAK